MTSFLFLAGGIALIHILQFSPGVEAFRRLPSDRTTADGDAIGSGAAAETPAAGGVTVAGTRGRGGGDGEYRRRLLESVGGLNGDIDRVLSESGGNSASQTLPGFDDGVATPTNTEGAGRSPAVASFDAGDYDDAPPENEVHKGENSRWRSRLKGLPSPDDHLVRSLPLLNPSDFQSRHYAGHIPASPNANDKKLFYWLFEPPNLELENEESRHPLLIWLNGGPGCSSMDGLFLENGPFRLVPTDDGKGWRVDVSKYSWHNAPAWVLYIDQPVGTGLSFTKKGNYCKDDAEVNADFHYFLVQFLTAYGDIFLTEAAPAPEGGDEAAGNIKRRVLNRPLFFSGESHAGHYIPSMIDYILKANDNGVAGDATDPVPVFIPVTGAAIGNGWMDPYRQYAAASAAYGMGLVDLSQKAALDEMEVQCQEKMDNGNLDAGVCFELLDKIVEESRGSDSKYKVSTYDSTKWEPKHRKRTFPPGHKDVENYLGGWKHSAKDSGHPGSVDMAVDNAEVLRSLHAEESVSAKQKYQECTDPPFDALRHQDGLGVVTEVVRVLNHPSQPRLLFFNGMNDLICNHVGNEKFLDELPWEHAADWRRSNRYSWDGPPNKDGGEKGGGGPPAGYVREYRNLLFLKILNAGHMVPMDLPEVALEMMRILMHEGASKEGPTFQTFEQKMSSKDPGNKGEKGSEEESSGGEVLCEPCPSCDSGGGGGTDSVPLPPRSDAGLDTAEPADVEMTTPVPAQTETLPSPAIAWTAGPMKTVLIAGGWVGGFIGSIALCFVLRNRNTVAHVESALEAGDFDFDDDDLELKWQSEDGLVEKGGYRDNVPNRGPAQRKGSSVGVRMSSSVVPGEIS